MKKRFIFGFLTVLVLCLILGVIFVGPTKVNLSRLGNNPTAVATPTPKTAPIATVTLTGSGFTPNNLKVEVGTRVVFLNTSGTNATVNSDPYPYNTKWLFLNLGSFANNSSVSTIFNKAGIYIYHNDLKPEQKGIVTVK